MARPKKGARLVYTGGYDPDCTYAYPPGAVVGYRSNRFHGPSVTVRLDGDEELYADWPISVTAPAPVGSGD